MLSELAEQKLKFSELLGIDVGTVISPLVDMWLPNQWTLSDADLCRALGLGDNEDIFEQTRNLVQTGLAYTSEDLRGDLGARYETVEDIRQWIADGFHFTEEDLRNSIRGEGASGRLQAFDNMRTGLGTLRHWKWVAWLIPLLLLVAIWVLGGQTWNHRLLWAAAVLAMAAIMAYIVFGPLFSIIVQPKVDEVLIQAVGQTKGYEALLVGKGALIAQNIIDDFVSGLKSRTLILVGASLVLIVIGCVWPIWTRRCWRRRE